jgi:hypothetical protein
MFLLTILHLSALTPVALPVYIVVSAELATLFLANIFARRPDRLLRVCSVKVSTFLGCKKLASKQAY